MTPEPGHTRSHVTLLQILNLRMRETEDIQCTASDGQMKWNNVYFVTFYSSDMP